MTMPTKNRYIAVVIKHQNKRKRSQTPLLEICFDFQTRITLIALFTRNHLLSGIILSSCGANKYES